MIISMVQVRVVQNNVSDKSVMVVFISCYYIAADFEVGNNFYRNK